MLCVELDRIDELAAASRLFAHNRFGVLSIDDRDHGFRDGRPLRAFVEKALIAQGLTDYGARIEFMTMPRFFGYAFNPISFYYCYNAAGELGAVLHQVKNTFGGQVGYLIPVRGPGVMHQRVAKSIVIHYGTPEERRMTATMKLAAAPWSTAAILRRLVLTPFTPLKVIVAIHWQALLIFIRGAKFHPLAAQNHAAIIPGDVL